MKIVIVGGGTSGWITLAYLVATTKLDIVIIHSDEIDTLGVGESTTPTIKHVAETCGLDEKTWMKRSKASFKYGIEFLNFNNIGSRWFHSFDDFKYDFNFSYKFQYIFILFIHFYPFMPSLPTPL